MNALRSWPRMPYFENPGVPTAEERGVYCPHGEKVAEFSEGEPEKAKVVEPWPCNRLGCTKEVFEAARAEMEADLNEASRHAFGCNGEPYREGLREGDLSC